MPGSFGKELVRQGAGIVKSGSAPTSGNTGSGKSGIRKTDPVKNGQAAGRKIVKSAAGKAAGKIIGTKAVAGAVGAAVIGGGAVAGYHIHQAKEQKVTKEEWDLGAMNRELLDVIPTLPPVTEEDAKDKEPKEIKHLLKERAAKAYEEKEAQFPEAEHLREVERVFLLRVIDAKWMDHIDDMDQLRQGIGLQAYGQRDPLVEYKMIGYDMFGEMTRAIEVDTVRLLFHVNVEQKVEREQVAKVTGTNKDDSVAKGPKVRAEKKIYPNDPCPCGSGKKYKQCCGRK